MQEESQTKNREITELTESKMHKEFLDISMNIQDCGQRLRKCLRLCQREGMKELCAFLEKTDYYIAPASTRFHLSCEGGLAKHHWNAVWNLFQLNIQFRLKLSLESVIIIGALHDACKIQLYHLLSDGTYKCDKEVLKRGHGILSVERVSKFITLTDCERDAILYHMNLFYCSDCNDKWIIPEYTVQDLNKSIRKFPVTQIFSAIDMGCSRLEADLEHIL